MQQVGGLLLRLIPLPFCKTRKVMPAVLGAASSIFHYSVSMLLHRFQLLSPRDCRLPSLLYLPHSCLLKCLRLLLPQSRVQGLQLVRQLYHLLLLVPCLRTCRSKPCPKLHLPTSMTVSVPRTLSLTSRLVTSTQAQAITGTLPSRFTAQDGEIRTPK